MGAARLKRRRTRGQASLGRHALPQRAHRSRSRRASVVDTWRLSQKQVAVGTALRSVPCFPAQPSGQYLPQLLASPTPKAGGRRRSEFAGPASPSLVEEAASFCRRPAAGAKSLSSPVEIKTAIKKARPTSLTATKRRPERARQLGRPF